MRNQLSSCCEIIQVERRKLTSSKSVTDILLRKELTSRSKILGIIMELQLLHGIIVLARPRVMEVG